MQIVFFTNNDIDINKIKEIINYDKSLEQNILLVNYSSIYTKDIFIYSRECLIVRTSEIAQDVLLSPSLVIDLDNASQSHTLENYLTGCWVNALHAFYQKQDQAQPELIDTNLSKPQGLSQCICYTDNNDKPLISVMQDSIEIDAPFNEVLTPFNSYGLIDQAVTEFFSDNNFFTQFEWPRNSEISSHQSMAFLIRFTIVEANADYNIEIESFETINFIQLVNYNRELVFKYLDKLIKFRLDRYIEQVKFRTHIIKLCEQYQIDLEPSYYRTFILTKGEHIGLQRRYYGSVNSNSGIAIINNKHKTNEFLKEKGFNTNKSYEYSLADLKDQKTIDEIPLQYPMVLKPTDKKEGYGVVTNIQSPDRMLYSVKKLLKMEDIDSVIVEEFFQGISYRVLVVGGEVVAVLKFIPANITGNGKTSIDDLIRSKNLLSKSRIRINNALRLSIFNDGKRWETILPDGEKYILSHNSHASNGGQATNVTELFEDKYKKVAVSVCETLGLKIAGIDMIVNEQGDYRILEINCGPALATHVNPKHGTSIPTYSMVLKTLLETTDLTDKDNAYLPELVKYHQ